MSSLASTSNFNVCIPSVWEIPILATDPASTYLPASGEFDDVLKVVFVVKPPPSIFHL